MDLSHHDIESPLLFTSLDVKCSKGMMIIVIMSQKRTWHEEKKREKRLVNHWNHLSFLCRSGGAKMKMTDMIWWYQMMMRKGNLLWSTRTTLHQIIFISLPLFWSCLHTVFALSWRLCFLLSSFLSFHPHHHPAPSHTIEWTEMRTIRMEKEKERDYDTSNLWFKWNTQSWCTKRREKRRTTSWWIKMMIFLLLHFSSSFHGRHTAHRLLLNWESCHLSLIIESLKECSVSSPLYMVQLMVSPESESSQSELFSHQNIIIISFMRGTLFRSNSAWGKLNEKRRSTDDREISHGAAGREEHHRMNEQNESREGKEENRTHNWQKAGRKKGRKRIIEEWEHLSHGDDYS